MVKHILKGCTPEPLGNYLKSIGILRLVSEQIDKEALGYWEEEYFVLETKLSKEELEKFFIEEYEPTPLVSPWNGGSGFYPEDNKVAIETIMKTFDPKFKKYREIIEFTKKIVNDKKPDKKEKVEMLEFCRNNYPDWLLPWLDSVYVLTDKDNYQPLLGTGGNILRLDLSNNYMQRIVDLFISKEKTKVLQYLKQALWMDTIKGLVSAAIGMYDPGHAGGYNATTGFEQSSIINPWNFILIFEGAILFAGTTSRKLSTCRSSKSIFPFTVNVSAIGFGSSSEEEKDKSKAEIWLPIWNNPCKLNEIKFLLSEGRSEIKGRQAKNGLDFARAIAEVGVDRGIRYFTRFGIIDRFGRSPLAVPLGRIHVKARPEVTILNDLDQWIASIKIAIRMVKEIPSSLKNAVRNLEKEMFDYSIKGGRVNLLRVFIAIGKLEYSISRIKKLHRKGARPLQGLQERWVEQTYDNSVEYRIALSITSVCTRDKEKYERTNFFRIHLESVEYKGYWEFDKDPKPHVIWSERDLYENLNEILKRRYVKSGKLSLDGEQFCSINDISRYIAGELNYKMISDLVLSFSLLEWQKRYKIVETCYRIMPQKVVEAIEEDSIYNTIKVNKDYKDIQREYILFKPFFSNYQLNDKVDFQANQNILSLIFSNKIEEATEKAIQIYISKGLIPIGSTKQRKPVSLLSGIERRLLLSSMIFPLNKNCLNEITKIIIRINLKDTNN